jgi:phospholipid transport system substrate-binding protein
MHKINHAVALLALVGACQFAEGAMVSARADEVQATPVSAARENFARMFAQQVMNILQDSKKQYDDRKNVLRQAFANSVDIDWIARFVLGRSWSTATPEQRERYTALYRRYLTESYVTRFAEDSHNTIRDIAILGVHDEAENDFTVRTKMRLANLDTLGVSYLVRDKGGSYQVVDIAIENISLITTHRAEFSALADTRGVDGVVAKLEELLGSGTPPPVKMSMNERR